MNKIFDKKVLIGIVIVAGLVWYMNSGSGSPSGTATSTTPTTNTATTAKTTTTVKKTVVPVASQPVSLSYQQALQTYTGSLRIQLSGDAFCQANPTNVMFKNGTSIMIDNRSANARTIRIGSTAYSLTGYGFKIVKLSSTVLPTTLVMDCGTQQNIARITLQK